MANETIGFIKCAITGERAEVRRYATGKRKLYYVSNAGMITPNLPAGQSWIEENATFFENNPDAQKEPSDAARAAVRLLDEPTPEKQAFHQSTDAKTEQKTRKKRSLWEHLINDDE